METVGLGFYFEDLPIGRQFRGAIGAVDNQQASLAFLHIELNVENPVFAGDTIHAECEIIEERRSRSPPIAASSWRKATP